VIRAFSLTPSQRKALDSQRNIAVTASAGSGKTATLVERYLELLRAHPGIGVRSVLAITFTQKAAAEMRDRVAARLKKTLDREPDPDERRRLAAVYEDLSGARIGTIHAFCAGVLREHPVEAGVDPGFSVLEEVEATRMRHQAVRETLETLATRPDGDSDKQALRRLLQEWERRYLDTVLDCLVRRKRLVRYWSRRYLEMSPEQIHSSWRESLRALQEPACQDLLRRGEFLPRLGELAALTPLEGAAPDSAEKILAPARPHIRSLLGDPSLETALETLPGLAVALTTASGQPYKTARLGKKACWDPEALARCRQALADVGSRLAPHREVFGQTLGSRDLRAAQVLRALARVFLQVDARYAQKKGPGTLLDFDDLQEKALDLIRAGDGQIGRRLARQYRFVLVDEFQDTDQLQWDLIRALISTDGQLDPDKLFIVGDPKQSIYSFRGADVAVFARVQDAILAANDHHQRQTVPFRSEDGEEVESRSEERSGVLVMGENFRTLAAPVAFVNFLFPQFMQAVEGELFQVGYDPLICQRAEATGQGSVELLLAPTEEGEEDLDSLQREAELLARRLRRLLDEGDLPIAAGDELRPPRPGDVAVLLRRRRNLSAYEQALRGLHIPFQVVGGLGFYQRQEIYDLANILRVLCNPRDGVALLGALRSPYFALSDNALFALAQLRGGRLWDKLRAAGQHPDHLSPADQQAIRDAVELLDRWRRLKDRVSLVELLHAVLADTGAWGFLSFGERGEQNLANLGKFLGLARSFEGGGFSTLTDFVAHLDLLTDEEEKEGEAQLAEEGGDAVQLLTIHAAKGLEFPIVFVPDLDGEFNLRLSEAALVDPEHGIGLAVLDPEAGFGRRPSFVRQLISGGHQRRTIAEEKRLFYVATTRARDHLLLSGRLQNPPEQPPSFEAARDRLSWVCRGLELTRADLDQGEKSFIQDGERFSVRIYTDPDQIPVQARQTRPAELAYRRVREDLQQEGKSQAEEWPSALQGLLPLEDESFLPAFSATELVLFEESPEAYFQQHVLGLEPWDPTCGDQPRRRGLLFGELAHAVLEELVIHPDGDEEARVDRLLLGAALPAEAWRAACRRDLLDLVRRFRKSAFGKQLLSDPTTRVEQPFSLKLQNGVINGVIDRICLGEDGLGYLIDFKTSRIPASRKKSEARRYRRQLEIYALCLQQLFPDQPEYRATVYFTSLDDTYTFRFSPADLEKARGEVEKLIEQLAEQGSPAMGPR